MDISTVAGSFVVETDAADFITHARLAFGGVAATPALALKTATFLTGKPWTRETLHAAGGIAQSEFSPLSDVRGSAAYRHQLMAGMVQRFFEDKPWSAATDPITPINPIHPIPAKYEVAHDKQGRILALKSEVVSNGGWALDLSTAITDRALLHHDNAYYIPNLHLTGRVAKTHLSRNTAFRGFGGPQGMLIIEKIIAHFARRCGLAPEVVRERNLHHGTGETNTTHYGQDIGDQRIPRLWQELTVSSDLTARRAALAEWNAGSPHHKRGIAMTPVKFGISFTLTHLNQAGALVLIYQDGTVQINHGGTEMGQGLHTKIRTIVCRELGLTPDRVRLMPTRTD